MMVAPNIFKNRRMNERLKIIAKEAGIKGRFTTYNIRHSWATIAKHLGVSRELISEALGHSSLRTTQIYLKDFDTYVWIQNPVPLEFGFDSHLEYLKGKPRFVSRLFCLRYNICCSFLPIILFKSV